VTANDNCDPAHVQWSRNLFAGLSDGGVWAVPRCGLLFTKRGNELHLTARMPHDPKMPISASELSGMSKPTSARPASPSSTKHRHQRTPEREAEMPDVHDLSD
jgi:hypothetical protein